MDLLSRLKIIRVNSRNVIEKKPATVRLEAGRFDKEKAEEILKLHLSEPLKWNPNVLARIYSIDENDCSSIVRYLRPAVGCEDIEVGPVRAYKVPKVYDMKLFKEDAQYMYDIKKLIFVDTSKTKLGVLAIKLSAKDKSIPGWHSK